MNTAAPIPPLDEATIVRVLQASKAEAAAGRMPESDQLLARVAQQAPNHPAVLNELGVRMLGTRRSGAGTGFVRTGHQRATATPGAMGKSSSSLKALGRRAEELDAIEKALEIEPRHLSALLQKGAYLEEAGDTRNAARTYQNALDCLPPGAEAPLTVKDALAKAKFVVDADRAALTRGPRSAAGRDPRPSRRRAAAARGPMPRYPAGQSPRFHSSPTWMYFPQLPEIEFFERTQFPWLDEIESATPEIRAELLRVLVADREGLQPYIDFPSSMPLDQFRELNRSRRWSAYFLWNQSEAVAGHIARCPATARALEKVPRCRIERRAPTAFFSILDAKTRIPGHTGITNTRLTVHLPLVVPPDCGFRVGGTTREWIPGQAWVFDDTIEHEAWNESDTPRAILIFDIWNPLLSEAERDMIKTATEVYGQYYSVTQEPVAQEPVTQERES